MSNPPVNTVPGAQTVAEDTALTFSTANSNLISVSDDVSTTLTVSITATNGRFSLSRVTGLTFGSGSNGSAAMTFSGTTTNLNAALAGARYNSNLNFNGAGSVVIATTDQDTPALTDTDTIAVTVTARNDAPVAIGSSSNILLNGTKVFSLADFPFTDVEGNSLVGIVVRGVPANGSLTFDADGVGGNAATAVTIDQSISAADIAAGKLVFTAGASGNTASFTYRIQDDGGTANGGADTSFVVARTLVTVNIPPVVNAGPNVAVPSGTVTALTGLSVSDDNATLTATFTVANGALTLRTDVADGLTGSSIVSGANGSNTIIVRGTPAAINATLSAPNGLTYIGEEADTLTLRVSDSVNTTVQSVGASQVYGDGTHSAAIADVTGDGLADIITASPNGGAITVGVQTSSGGFNPITVYVSPSGIALDAIVTSTNSVMDSSPDLLVATLTGGVASLINSGTGAFAQAQIISIPETNAIVAGDFNSDGFADFATANRNGTVSVALHNGTSLYLAPTSYATTGSGPNWDIVTADFDEDGDLDLLVSTGSVLSGGGISFLRGNGNGTFAAASAVAGIGGASQIATADFNNDGHMDFAVASYAASTVVVFLGTGTGAFASGVSYNTVSQAIGLVAGDFNGDGIVDLHVGGYNNNQVRFLLGSGDGTFTPGNTLGGYLFSGAAGDIDGDGDLDIAAATWPGPFYLYINRSPAGIATDQAQITIAPADLFDVTSPTDTDNASNTVAENATVGAVVGITAFATDADTANNTVTYSLISDAGGRFTINSTTGVVTVASALDYESGTSHDITVGAASSDGSTSDAMFTITVGDVNEAPSITSNGTGPTAAISIAENTTAVTDVDAGDGDAGSVLTYEIVGGADAAAFAIDAATGALSLLAPADFEAPADVGGDNVYEVIVGVSDGLLSDTQTLNVTITDAIDPPQNVTLTLDNDSYTAATNEDYVIDGLEGDDTITTGSGNDIVHGNLGSDTISTGDGDDTITYDGLEDGADVIDGGAGSNDRIIALNDNTVIRLRSFTGIETISANGNAGVTISGSWQADTLDFSSVNIVGITAFNAGSGNDHLTGTSGADTIIGAGGFDTLIGGGGDDVFQMSVGSGIDNIDGGTGYDTLLATSANTVFYWGSFSNVEAINGNGYAGARIVGFDNAETMDVSGLELSGIEVIDGGRGNDTITGTEQGDTIFGNAGDDTINAGGGDDTIQFRGLTLDVIDGGSGIDTLRAIGASSSIRWDLISNVEAVDGAGFAGVTLSGSTLADTLDVSGVTLTDVALIDGGGGNDTMTGTAQGDTIFGNFGDDTINAGGGDDTILFRGLTLDVVDGGSGIDTLRATARGAIIRWDLVSNVEVVDGSGFAGVTLTGSTLADVLDVSGVTLTDVALIDGGAGNDTITGTAQGDTIFGNTGDDTINAGGGDDTIQFRGLTLDVVDGGSGIDTLRATANGASIRWDLISNVEVVDGTGFAGVTLSGSTAANMLDVSGVTLTDVALIDGGGGNDTITGTAQSDTIFGNIGDDTINAGGGDDTILFRGLTIDTVDGGSGIDTLRATGAGSSIRWDLISNVEAVDGAGFAAVTLIGSTLADALDVSGVTLTNIALIDGGGGNDTITGTAQGDTIFGNTGDDTINAGGGDDTIQFRGLTLDVVDGGSGIDTLRATGNGSSIRWDLISNVEAVDGAGFAGVALTGSTAADTLDVSGVTLTNIALIDAGAGNDTVIGSAGADVLLATAGKDSLTGGGGADTFRFNALGDSRTGLLWDSITDFAGGEDKIDLSRIDAVLTSPGDQAFTFIGTGGFNKIAGELRYDNGTTDYTRVLGDVNGDGIADFEIRLDWIGANPHILSAADFIL